MGPKRLDEQLVSELITVIEHRVAGDNERARPFVWTEIVDEVSHKP
jgi:hypothetical protein